jgi:hypothetical protein
MTVVCATCGSSDIYQYALVGVNNPDNILTFADTYCQQCGDRCETEPYSGNWVIVSEETDDDGGEPGSVLYWSNEDGWGHRSTATEYTTAEKTVMNLPQDALGWQPAQRPDRTLS